MAARAGARASGDALAARDRLLDAVEGTRRGAATTPAARAAIEEAVDELERLGKGETYTGAELSAAWRLVWTTEKETLWLLENGGLFGTAAGERYEGASMPSGGVVWSCWCMRTGVCEGGGYGVQRARARICAWLLTQVHTRSGSASYQVIDVEAGSLNNIITFPPGGLFNVDSDISADGAQRTNFQFTAAALTVGEPFPLLGGRTFNLPPKGQGWFDTVYMDERIRVAKDIRGDTLVVERSDYVIPK